MRLATLYIVLLAACSSDGVTTPTPATLNGTWHHVRAQNEPPGFFRQFTLTVSGTTLTGSGTWSGEAGPQGTLTVTGSINGDSIHLDLLFTVTIPTPGQGFVQHFDGRLSSPTDLIGTITAEGTPAAAEHFTRDQ